MTSETGKLPHLIVGAGIDGIQTADIFDENNIPYVLFERSSSYGGVWDVSNDQCGYANNTSVVQSDPVIYTMPGYFKNKPLTSTGGPFNGINTTVDGVMTMLKDQIKEKNIVINFNRKVTKFDENNDGTVSVTWEDTKSGEVHVDSFAGVHFRTGRLNIKKEVHFDGENIFYGIIKNGCKNNCTSSDFKGKNVVIVGWASFAIENAARALLSGAKSIHIVSRSDKFQWFSYGIYTAARQFYNVKAADPSHLESTWDKIFDSTEKAAEHCGVKDIILSKETYWSINGKRHFYAENGLFSTNFDHIALAMHYGLVKYHRDTVKTLEPGHVLTGAGSLIPADMIIKCTGFDLDLGLLNGHYIQDNIWVDGRSNITSYHSVDGLAEGQFFGPKAPVMNTFLISPFALGDFDRTIISFMKDPEKFYKFKELPDFSQVSKPEKSGIDSITRLFRKFFAFGDEEIIGNFLKSMTEKNEDYERVLDEQKFLVYDKMKWDAWSYFLSKRTGKSFLEYPYIDKMIGNEKISTANLDTKNAVVA